MGASCASSTSIAAPGSLRKAVVNHVMLHRSGVRKRNRTHDIKEGSSSITIGIRSVTPAFWRKTSTIVLIASAAARMLRWCCWSHFNERVWYLPILFVDEARALNLILSVGQWKHLNSSNVLILHTFDRNNHFVDFLHDFLHVRCGWRFRCIREFVLLSHDLEFPNLLVWRDKRYCCVEISEATGTTLVLCGEGAQGVLWDAHSQPFTFTFFLSFNQGFIDIHRRSTALDPHAFLDMMDTFTAENVKIQLGSSTFSPIKVEFGSSPYGKVAFSGF